MISRILLSILVAIIVTLACILLGAILISLQVSIAVTIGDFLKHFSSVIGILAGLWYFFTGSTWPTRAA